MKAEECWIDVWEAALWPSYLQVRFSLGEGLFLAAVQSHDPNGLKKEYRYIPGRAKIKPLPVELLLQI